MAIWHKNYPKGVPHEINEDVYPNLVALFEESFEKHADQPCIVNMDKMLTYKEVKEYADGFAKYLQEDTQLKKGDRIAIQMPNLLQFYPVMMGAIKAGLIVVNTNPLYTSDEMRHQFKDSGAKAVVILENFANNLEKILPDTEIEYVFTTKIGDLIGGLKGSVVNLVVKYVKKMVPSFNLPNAIPLKTILHKYKGQSPKPVALTQEDTAFLQYTGGTTGISKGAELSHKNILINVEQIFAWISYRFENQEIVVTPLPLYHIFALTVNCITFFRAGFKNVLITNPRDMKSFLKDMVNNPPNYLTGVNTLFNGMMNHPLFTEIDFSRTKVSLGGGMAVQEAVATRWKKLTGNDLLEGYGLSETSPVAAVNPCDGNHKRGAVGLPVPNTDIKIFNDDREELSIGEAGEIGIKGPQVMKGYWNRPDETERCFHKGYFLTGDIGVLDNDGFVKIVDRKKEMINVSGFKVFPNEVEDVIARHPKVLEVGVKGVDDDKTTEAVKAFVVKRDATLTVEELQEYCHQYLTNYKVPKSIVFRDELPKTNVGKILRRKLE